MLKFLRLVVVVICLTMTAIFGFIWAMQADRLLSLQNRSLDAAEKSLETVEKLQRGLHR